MTALAVFFRTACRQLLTLLVWLLLGLQVMTPLVHAHTHASPTHSGFHLPEFQQQHQDANGWVTAHFSQNDGMAVGVAQGLPHPPQRAAVAQAALPADARPVLPQPLCFGCAWAQAPPFIPVSFLYFSTPPSQAPPPVLL
jgi:hypothetical protein